MESMERTIDELEEEVVQARKQLMRAKEEGDRAARGKRRAERELKDVSDSLERLREELEREAEENDAMRSNVRRMEAEIKRHERASQVASGAGPGPAEAANAEEVLALQKELSGARGEVSTLKAEGAAARREARALQEEASALSESLEKRKAELEQEMHASAELRKRLLAAEATVPDEGKGPDPEAAKELEELRGRCEASENRISDLKGERRAQKEQLGVMRSLLLQAQSELKTRAAESAELQATIETVRASAAANLDQAEKEKAAEIERVVQGRLAAARSVADAEIAAVRGQLEAAEAKLVEEMTKRRRLHNRVMELQGNIRVYCRARPVSATEEGFGDEKAAVVVRMPANDDGSVLVRASLEQREIRSDFDFDAGFWTGSTQAGVFERVHPFVVSAMDGYNCCIFAYGQTGSGKTYTMEGRAADRGVNVRALDAMFEEAGSRAKNLGMQYTFAVTMCEIYQEEVYDLLPETKVATRTKIQLRQGKGGAVYAEGLNSVPVATTEDVERLVKRGHKNRSVGAHNFNEHSSRSHLVVAVEIRREIVRDDGRTMVRVCTLNLVDLAGSERISKTDAKGVRLKEAQSINKSLSALGDVIGALGGASKHVPYRNSKLTWLLSGSLSGNSKVLMFVCISPTKMCVSETMCSLNFAQRCRSTELGRASKVGESSGGGAGGARGHLRRGSGRR
jgi:kinesin family protein C2/C3